MVDLRDLPEEERKHHSNPFIRAHAERGMAPRIYQEHLFSTFLTRKEEQE